MDIVKLEVAVPSWEITVTVICVSPVSERRTRSRVVGILPNEASAIRLDGAILADHHDEWQATDRRYLSEDSMSLLYPQRDSLTTAELTAGN